MKPLSEVAFRSIPQSMARSAGRKLAEEVRASIAAAKAGHKTVSGERTMMIARISSALKEFEEDLGIKVNDDSQRS
jgi:hypothetical protein